MRGEAGELIERWSALSVVLRGGLLDRLGADAKSRDSPAQKASSAVAGRMAGRDLRADCYTNNVASQACRVHINSVEIVLMPLSPAQCRAARALLNWSQEELVRQSKITKKTIADFERGATQPRPQTLAQILAAFDAAGIEFLDGNRPGVRLSKRPSRS